MEINLEKLMQIKNEPMKYKEISKFPNVQKDLAFVMKKDKKSEDIEKVIKKAGGKLLKDIEVFDVYTGENVANDEKSIAYTLTFNNSEKTLDDEEIMELFNKIIEKVEKECMVTLRRE